MRYGDTVFIFFRVPKEPEVKQVLDYNIISKELHKRFGALCNVQAVDEKYRITTEAEVQRLLEANFHKFKNWQWDNYDCDNFAFSLKGLMGDIAGNLCFGIVFVNTPAGKHALNIFRDEKSNWFYVEPQNNAIFNVGGADAILKGYKPYLVII